MVWNLGFYNFAQIAFSIKGKEESKKRRIVKKTVRCFFNFIKIVTL